MPRWVRLPLGVCGTVEETQTERDIMARQVIPRLRQWCAARQVDLIDLDLRWGLPVRAGVDRALRVRTLADQLLTGAGGPGDLAAERPLWVVLLGRRLPGLLRPGREGAQPTPVFRWSEWLGDDAPWLQGVLLADLWRGLDPGLPYPAGSGPADHEPRRPGTIDRPARRREAAAEALYYLREDDWLEQLPSQPAVLRRIFDDGAEPDPRRRADLLERLTRLREHLLSRPGARVRRYSVRWVDEPAPVRALPLVCPAPQPEVASLWAELWHQAGLIVEGTELSGEVAIRARAFDEQIGRGRPARPCCAGEPWAEVVLRDLQEAVLQRLQGREPAGGTSPLAGQEQALQAALRHGPPIGRERELAVLRRATADEEGGAPGRPLVILGEEGVGRTALCAGLVQERLLEARRRFRHRRYPAALDPERLSPLERLERTWARLTAEMAALWRSLEGEEEPGESPPPPAVPHPAAGPRLLLIPGGAEETSDPQEEELPPFSPGELAPSTERTMEDRLDAAAPRWRGDTCWRLLGAAGAPRDSTTLLRQLLEELQEVHGLPAEAWPREAADLHLEGSRLLGGSPARPLLLFDGLDELAPGPVEAHGWLPRSLEPGQRLVLSCRRGSATGEQLERLALEGSVEVLRLEPLAPHTRRDAARRLLDRHCQELEGPLLDRLVLPEVTGLPLALRLRVEELRLLGSRGLVLEELQRSCREGETRDAEAGVPEQALPREPPSLRSCFESLLDRLEQDRDWGCPEPARLLETVLGELAGPGPVAGAELLAALGEETGADPAWPGRAAQLAVLASLLEPAVLVEQGEWRIRQPALLAAVRRHWPAAPHSGTDSSRKAASAAARDRSGLDPAPERPRPGESRLPVLWTAAPDPGPLRHHRPEGDLAVKALAWRNGPAGPELIGGGTRPVLSVWGRGGVLLRRHGDGADLSPTNLPGHLRQLAANDRWIAARGEGSLIRVWDASLLQATLLLDLGPLQPEGMALAGDRLLLSVRRPGVVKVLDPGSGARRGGVDVRTLRRLPSAAADRLSGSPLLIWDLDRERFSEWVDSPCPAGPLAALDHGRRALCVAGVWAWEGAELTGCVLDLRHGRPVARIEPPPAGCTALAVQEGWAALAGPDDADPGRSQVRLWDLEQLCPLQQFTTGLRRVQALAWGPGREWLALGGGEWPWSGTGERLELREPRSGRRLAALVEATDDVTALQVTPDGWLAGAADDGAVHLWQLPDTGSFSVLPGGGEEGEEQGLQDPRITLRAAVWTLAVDTHRQRVLCGDRDGVLQVRDPETGQLLARPLPGGSGPVVALTLTPDGEHAVAAVRAKGSYRLEPQLYVVDLRDGQVALVPLPGRQLLYGLAVTGEGTGTRILTAGEDRRLRVHRLHGGELLRTLHGHEASIDLLLTIPGHPELALTRDRQGLALLWNLRDGRILQRVVEEGAEALPAVVSPDGRWLYTGEEGQLRRRELALPGLTREAPPLRIGAHTGVAALACPGGSRLISLGGGELKIWDTVDQRLLASCPTAMDRLCLLGGAVRPVALWREGDPLLELHALPRGELFARHRAGAALRCVADGTRGRILLGTELGPESIGLPPPGRTP